MDFSNQIRQSGSWTALYKDWENKKLDLTIQDPSSRYETAASAEACRSLEPAAKRTSNPFQQPANHATYSNLFRKSKQTQTTNITKKGSKKRQAPSTPKPNQTGAIFPFDIFFMIAKYSNIIDLTSLGLTSSGQYAVLRQFHPGPLLLLTRLCHDDPHCPGQGMYHQLNCKMHFLHHRVGEWLGPKYFLSGNNKSVVFLNSEVYDTLADKSIYSPIHQRRKDYKASHLYHEKETKPIYLLPNPHNKGEAWYEEAIQVIAASYSSFQNLKGWTGYWKKFEVFRDNRGIIKRERKAMLRKRGHCRRTGEKKVEVKDKSGSLNKTGHVVGKYRRKVWTKLGKPSRVEWRSGCFLRRGEVANERRASTYNSEFDPKYNLELSEAPFQQWIVEGASFATLI
ncbi:hypothetical protein BKA61DRAFT_581822 [Leptodontidium sp. MPI-SDFR-AT-0119]|nr:hypothetical protein BKA61DRAFT_581822 [Leptodontidium sp. MPI-SDFR-AT-0119]